MLLWSLIIFDNRNLFIRVFIAEISLACYQPDLPLAGAVSHPFAAHKNVHHCRLI